MSTALATGLRDAFREIAGAYADLTGRTVAFAPQGLGRHIEPGRLGGYYCDFRHKALHSDEGMPANTFSEEPPWVIPVAQTALGYWDLRLDGEDVEGEFLRLADWLLAGATPDDAGGVVWRIEVEVPKYGLTPGWVSAMGQSQAISVLLRAHALSGRAECLETARAASRVLHLPVRDGGTQAAIAGVPVLEEYPTKRPSAVLNGWIFALFGLHELSLATGDATAGELFEQSAQGLVELLPRYDTGWWSLYSLYDHGRPDLAKPFYQRLHPVLLEALDLVRPAPALGAYARRWRAQYTRVGMARASLDKLAFRVRRGLRPG
jgi:heparosan-N-sulfate-glucuronate 5-epimerase